MRSILFHIPAETAAGWPLFGWGLLLAVWAVVAVGWIGWSWRQGSREMAGLLAFLLLGAALIVFVLPAISDPAGLPIRGYGVMLLVAIALGAALARRRATQVGLDPDTIFSLMFVLVTAGVLGARLFYLIEYREHYRGLPPRQWLAEIANFTEGGLVVYGGLLAGGAAFTVYIHRYRLPGLAIADLIAPSVALGMGLGRIGCFLNGCCYGGPCDLPWAVRFPQGSPPHWQQVERHEIYFHGLQLPADPEAPPRIERVEPGSQAEAAGLRPGMRISRVGKENVATAGQSREALLRTTEDGGIVELTLADAAQPIRWTPRVGDQRSLPIHPAQLYSAIDGILLAAFLWSFFPFRARDGQVLAWLLTLHPVSRFLLEIIRRDEGSFFGTGLTISQNISLALFVAGLGLWLWLYRRPRGTAWPSAATV